MGTGDARIIRKLSAIVVADVVHYSRMMEADEVGTLARLKALRGEVIDPALRAHGGRLVKLMGDGLLAEFASAIDATAWALSVQRAAADRNDGIPEGERMQLRIGVNVGDVILEGDDLYGEGVNVAARLEPLAPPGGICMSAAVHDHVHGKVDAEFVARGEHTVKNIARPISIWCWAPGELAGGDSVPFRPREPGRKPTIGVRAFEASGSNADALLLASAVHDAVVGSLSNLSGMTLLADAARTDYVASATVQAAGQRYRAVVRLSENRTGEQFWSDRFEGELSELFQAQDDLAYRVSQAIRFQVYEQEVVAMEKVPATERTTEMMLSRIGLMIAGAHREEWAGAGPRLDSILLARPEEAGAHAMKACWHLYEVFYGWREIPAGDRTAAMMAAREAVRRNGQSDFAHTTLALVHIFVERDLGKAEREAARALELSPFYAIGHYVKGLTLVLGGRPAEGLDLCTRTLAVSPRFIMNHRIMQAAAIGAFLAGRFDEAIDWTHRSDQQVADVGPTLLIQAASFASAGRDDEAAMTRDRLLGQFPDFRLAEMRRWPFRNAADHDRLMAGLAAAGLPA